MGKHLMKITIRKNHNSNRVVLMKGMSIELILNSSSGISTREMEQICNMFSDKYDTKCESGFLKMSDIDMEKIS